MHELLAQLATPAGLLIAAIGLALGIHNDARHQRVGRKKP